MGADANEQGQSGAPSAETINTESHMIPKSRFDEVNSENKKLRAELEAREKAERERTEKTLLEQERYKERADKRAAELTEANAKAGKADAYEAAVNRLLETELASLPEEVRDLVPEDYEPHKKIDWIAKNKAKLLKPAPPNIGAGGIGAGDPNASNKPIPADFGDVAKAFSLSKEQADAAAKRLTNRS